MEIRTYEKDLKKKKNLKKAARMGEEGGKITTTTYEHTVSEGKPPSGLSCIDKQGETVA